MRAVVEMSGSSISLAILAALLAAACWFDVRSHRIPNRLVVIGIVAGLACNTSAASGLGFLAASHPGGAGFWTAALGALTGLGLFLPLYLGRCMGAGDVKLMAAIGSFVGPLYVVDVALTTFVMGGVLAAAVALWTKTVRQALGNAWSIVTRPGEAAAAHAGLTPGALSAGKVPYAVAIAAGTVAYVLLARAGHTFFA